MLKKTVIPFLAFLLAVAGAFAFKPAPIHQQGWFKNGSVVAQGDISVPGDSPACLTTNTTHTCLVGPFTAYDSSDDAMAQGASGVLKYN